MVKVDPTRSRIQIVDTGGGLDITIPAKRNLATAGFLAFWLIAWAYGAVQVISQLAAGSTAGATVFTVAWLGAWLVGGGAVILWMLWTLLGREIVRINATEIQYIRAIGPLSLKREYELAHVKRLRIMLEQPVLVGYRSFGAGTFSTGRIAFDYGSSTVRFGRDADDGEARSVVDAVTHRFRRLAANGDTA